MDLLRFISQMRVALHQCGRVALALQGKVEAEHKTPDSQHQQSTAVSVVDRVCQEILLLAAAQAAPELTVYSEEMGDCPAELRALFRERSSYELVLDPVDGTDDYLAGSPTFGHVLGLLNLTTGRFDLGMLFFPAVGVLLWSVRGMGPFVERGLAGTPRRLPKPAVPPTATEVKRLRDTDRQALAGLSLRLVPGTITSVAWMIWRLAMGEMGVAVLRQFHGHDTGPGSLVLEGLGGAMLGPDGEPMRYGADMARVPLVVASADVELARAVVEALGSGGERKP